MEKEIRTRLKNYKRLEKDYHLKSDHHQREGNQWTAGFCFGVATALGQERHYLGRIYKEARMGAFGRRD